MQRCLKHRNSDFCLTLTCLECTSADTSKNTLSTTQNTFCQAHFLTPGLASETSGKYSFDKFLNLYKQRLAAFLSPAARTL